MQKTLKVQKSSSEFLIKNGNIIVSSNPEDLTPMAKDDSKVLRKKTPWKIYKSSIKDRKIVSVAKF